MLTQFRCHVQGRSESKVHLAIGIKMAGKSKISHFTVPKVILVETKDILKLHISMSNLLFMHEVKCKKSLLDNKSSVSLTESVHFHHSSEQITAWDQFHDNKDVFFIFKQLSHCDNMRMINLWADFKFLSHKINIDFLFKLTLLDDFHSELGASLLMSDHSYWAEATTAKLLTNLIILFDIINFAHIGDWLLEVHSWLGASPSFCFCGCVTSILSWTLFSTRILFSFILIFAGKTGLKVFSITSTANTTHVVNYDY